MDKKEEEKIKRCKRRRSRRLKKESSFVQFETESGAEIKSRRTKICKSERRTRNKRTESRR